MIEPKTKVWIPYSQDGWHSGEVVATTPAGVKCIVDDGEVHLFLSLPSPLLSPHPLPTLPSILSPLPSFLFPIPSQNGWHSG